MSEFSAEDVSAKEMSTLYTGMGMWTGTCTYAGFGIGIGIQYPSYTDFPQQDFRLYGPSPWNILRRQVQYKGVQYV